LREPRGSGGGAEGLDKNTSHAGLLEQVQGRRHRPRRTPPHNLSLRRDALAGAAFLLAATLVVVGTLEGRRVDVGRNIFVNPPGIIDAYSTPTIAENPRRPDNEIAVFRKEAPRLSAQLAWSEDRNATWHTTALPLPPGDDRPFFPDAAFAPDGTLYVTYVNLTGSGNTPANLFVAHSSDGGRTLSPPSLIASGQTFQPRIAIGPDAVLHVVWLLVMRNGATPLTNASERVLAVQSTDRGLTWSAPVAVNAPLEHLVGAASPTVAGRGVLVVAYKDFGPRASIPGNGGTALPGQPYDLLVTRSIGGAAFSAPTVAASGVQSAQRFSYFFPEFPGIAAGPHDTVYLAWSAGREAVVQRSTNDGMTWQPPVHLHHPGGGSAALPAVFVAPEGRVDVVYINRPGGVPGLFTDIRLATSSDEGRNFRDIRLSSESFDSRIGPTFGAGLPPDLGSHLGLAGDNNTIDVAWGDTRLGTETTGREDIVAASVTGVGSAVTARWQFVAEGILVVVGLLLLAWGHLVRPRRERVSAVGESP